MPQHRVRLVCEALERRDAPAIVPLGPEFRANTVTNFHTADAAVALDAAGNFLIAWQAENADGSNNAIKAQRYLNTGAKLGNEFQVNTYTFGSQQAPATVGLPNGDFVIVWGSASAQDGSREGIFGRLYSAAGTPLTGEFQVNEFTLGIQGNASVAVDGDGDFVVAWEGFYEDGDGYGIFARRFNAAGLPLTGEFPINGVTTGDQRFPAVASDAAGNFVVTWRGDDSSGYGIYARRFNPQGQALTGEFTVNATELADQMQPGIAMDSDGDFTIVWQSQFQDAGSAGIYARRYTPAAAPIGSEFRVNTYTTGDQGTPAVAVNAAGDTVVTWQTPNQDGSGLGIYSQRYQANGQPIGGEAKVNFTTNGQQIRPAVASDNYGDYVVAWSSDNAPNSGIYAQHYGKPPVPVAQFTIDDGFGQASNITSVTLTFNTLVTIQPGSITLDGPLGPVTLTLDSTKGTYYQTTTLLTFSGLNVAAYGLIDGNYHITLGTTGIQNYDGLGYDGNGDGSPGPNGGKDFHRYFGDYDGDRDVDVADFAGLRRYFGTTIGQAEFRHYFDADADGDVDLFDFAAFRQHFNSTLAP